MAGLKAGAIQLFLSIHSKWRVDVAGSPLEDVVLDSYKYTFVAALPGSRLRG